MEDKKEITIKCPYCGYEYLPREIYLPNSFFGKGATVFRMENGTIECHDGDDMDLTETYKCDHCNHTFVVEADLKFKTSTINKYEAEAYEVPLKEND